MIKLVDLNRKKLASAVNEMSDYRLQQKAVEMKMQDEIFRLRMEKEADPRVRKRVEVFRRMAADIRLEIDLNLQFRGIKPSFSSDPEHSHSPALPESLSSGFLEPRQQGT